MDVCTIAFHRALLRQAKGMLSAYETWISDQEVAAMGSTLKRERSGLAKTSPLDNSANKS